MLPRILVLVVLVGLAPPATIGRTKLELRDVPTRVFLRVTEERAAGAPELERRDGLDAVALGRARAVAGLPRSRRMAHRRSIEQDLADANEGPFATVRDVLVVFRGGGVDRVVDSWRGLSDGWRFVTEDADAVGLAIAPTPDGMSVFVAVAVADASPTPTRVELPLVRADLEQAAFDAVNAERVSRGLEPLIRDDRLAGVARDHSHRMMSLGFFSHHDPGRGGLERRIRSAGIRFRRIAENLASNRGVPDPVATAVRGWLASDGHRTSMLDPSFRQSGMGVAIGPDRTVFFTQVFGDLPGGATRPPTDDDGAAGSGP